MTIGNAAKERWRSVRTWMRPKEATLGTVRLHIDPATMPDAMIRAIFRGDYEADERQAVERMVRPGDRIVEFGGGIGAVSLTAARIAGSGAVSVFEPQAQACHLINSNAALNAIEVNCQNAAVALESGAREFFQASNIISSSFFDRSISRKHQHVRSEVRTIALSEILKTSPNVMIVDIEGAEVELLGDANLDTIEVLIIEMHPLIVGSQAVASLDRALHSKGLHGLPRCGDSDTYVYSRGREAAF